MTDGGAAFQPGQEGLPFRPRGAYVGHEVFGHGDGAVLVEPEVARDLRSAAEFASQEGRIAGGLLYGRGLADDEGRYLVVDGFLKAGPGEDRSDHIARDGADSFTLSEADLGLLREDAARMYPAATEVGWWRTLAGPGEFGPRDFATQGELVGPGGVGLLVFGSGLEWGTAYLGPGGQVPGSARSFIPVPRPAPEAPPVPPRELGPVPGTPREPEANLERAAGPEPAPAPAPAPVTAAAPGTSLATKRQPVLTPPPQPTGPRVISPVRVPSRELGVKPANPGAVGPRTPTDVKVVVVLIGILIIVAAILIGMLTHSGTIALALAVIGLVVAGGVLLFARLN